MDLYHETTRYFGLSELLELTNSGSGLPLMRYDSSFETMATALEEKYIEIHTHTNTHAQIHTHAHTFTLCRHFKVNGLVAIISPSSPGRFLKLHSAIIRTTALIQHYCVALMAVSGRVSDPHNLQKHTTVETLEIVHSLLTAAQQCSSRHGHMILLRIPSPALAAWAQRRLSRVRRQLGLEQSFEIILGNPSQALNIGQSFIDRLKVGSPLSNV